MLLCESLVVAEYVAESFAAASEEDEEGGVLLPPSAEDRAVMRLFTELCGSCFSYFPLLRAGDEGETFVKAVDAFKEGLVSVDAFLTKMGDDDGPFLFGTRFSLAECNAAPFVQRACTILPALTGSGGGGGTDGDEGAGPRVDPLEICDELGLERLKCWMEEVLSRPSVVATGVPKAGMIESTTKMLARFAAMGN